MNDVEKKFSLLSELDNIAQNDNINDIYKEYCFDNVRFILINDVYYYIKAYEKLKIQLEDSYLHCIIISNGDNKHKFEVKYNKINKILIQNE